MPIRAVPKSWEGAGAPKLILENRPDRPIVLSRPITFIGQRRDAHVRLPVSGVSSLHAVIAVDSTGAWIYDLASRTGTSVNEHKVTEARLKSEDKIKIGAATLHFIDSRPDLCDESRLVPYAIETNEGTGLAVSGRFFSIGRRPGSNWRLESDDISLTHCVICQLDGNLFLRDAGSRRGTHLNGLRISFVQIFPSDLIAIGEARFRVKWELEEKPQTPIHVQDSEADPIQVDTPAQSETPAPRITDFSPELLDSLFGDQGASALQESAEHVMNDTGSVDWGFLRSAIPTIAAPDTSVDDPKKASDQIDGGSEIKRKVRA